MKPQLCKHILLIVFIFSLPVFTFAQSDSEKGIGFYRQDKNKEAINLLEKASKQTKTDALTWNFLGLAYLKEDNLKKAVKAFEKAVEYETKNASYHTNLAYAYLLNNKLDKAQNESTKAIELNRQNALAFYVRGTASLWEGEYGDAISDSDKAISVNSDYSQAYILKSDALLSTFGNHVGNGSKPFDEVNFLQQSKDVLEDCIKRCRNNSQIKLQQERLETVTIFYNYFSKNQRRNINSSTDCLE